MAWMNISRPNISASASNPKLALILLAALAAATPLPSAAQAARPAGETAPDAISRFFGTWEGTLEARNIATGKHMTVPATLIGKPQGSKALLDLTIDDGKGHIVRQPATISIEAPSRRLVRNPGDGDVSFNITSGELALPAGAPLALTLEARGSEDGRPADIREMLTITGDTLTWRRETRIDGQGWRFRNEYRLKRKA